jgi:hypothetical protein
MVFVLLLPVVTVTVVAAIFIVTLSATMRPGFLTRSVTEQRVYLGVTETLPALVRVIGAGSEAETSSLTQRLREQLTPQVFRSTAQQFFTDADAWIDGDTWRSPMPPQLNLSPLTQSSDPYIRALLQRSPSFLAVPPTPVTAFVRSVVRAVRFLAPVMIILVLLQLLGVFVTGKTLSARIRRVGVALLLPSTPGVLIAAILGALPKAIFGNSTLYTGLTAALLAPVGVLVTTLVAEIAVRMMYVFIALVPVSVLLFLFAGFVKHFERVREKARTRQPPP